jgi:GTP pyrophosphokinase
VNLHKGQIRKGSGKPYITHLLEVSEIVLDHGGDEDMAIAALLHDAVEDQGGRRTLEKIRRAFGDRVAFIVEGLSDAFVQPKPPWRERKEAYLTQLPSEPEDVRLVSAADKLHNVRALLEDYERDGDALWNRFKGGLEGTLWYYWALAEVFEQYGPRDIGQEMTRELVELERMMER